MEERMNFGVLASCLHGRACLRDEVNRRRKSHGVNHRGAREGTPSDIFFAPSRRCLIRTRPSSLKTRTRKVSHSVITRKPHQFISIPAICLFSDTMKTSERWRCTCCHESQKTTWEVRVLRRGLLVNWPPWQPSKWRTCITRYLNSSGNGIRADQKKEKQRREELWTVSEFWILVISVKWYLPCSTKKRIHISVWDNHTTTDAMAEGWTDAMHPLDQIKSVVLTNNVFQEVNYAMELWGIVERTKGLVKERSEITDN